MSRENRIPFAELAEPYTGDRESAVTLGRQVMRRVEKFLPLAESYEDVPELTAEDEMIIDAWNNCRDLTISGLLYFFTGQGNGQVTDRIEFDHDQASMYRAMDISRERMATIRTAIGEGIRNWLDGETPTRASYLLEQVVRRLEPITPEEGIMAGYELHIALTHPVNRIESKW